MRTDQSLVRGGAHLHNAVEAATTMNKTRNDLPKSARAAITSLLQPRLADALDLYTRCKMAHWNVKGPQFAALHGLFDQAATEALGYSDDLAERIVQLGGAPRGTAADVAKETSLPASRGKREGWKSHVEAVAGALASFGSSVRHGIDAAAKLGDADSADLLTEISRGVDKSLWMVEAHLDA